MTAIRPAPVIDGLFAATALTHDLTLVTRNVSDVAGIGATVLNSFEGVENWPSILTSRQTRYGDGS